ncbi:MAG: 5-formyltetrahydrofolate cyclo-ligase [Candidatus Thermoplasmatota archaeon]|nr:5-formyltetrahydrofolate cyclo-ligase [Candidatus Thermoplasmatota archaeon]
MERPRFQEKKAARSWAWDHLQTEGLARFPFPPHGRIPNFQGARQAAERLASHELLRSAERLKANPDAPQRYVRGLALQQGKVVVMPTPRLKGGFHQLDPARIPPQERMRAAALSNMGDYATEVPLEDLEPVDLIVTGSVAVTEAGGRVGKGEGYGDLEYAILQELGHPPAPVATTVHERQVVGSLPQGPGDLPLRLIATPERLVEIQPSGAGPSGILWDQLPDERIEEMDVLARLRERLGHGS